MSLAPRAARFASAASAGTTEASDSAQPALPPRLPLVFATPQRNRRGRCPAPRTKIVRRDSAVLRSGGRPVYRKAGRLTPTAAKAITMITSRTRRRPAFGSGCLRRNATYARLSARNEPAEQIACCAPAGSVSAHARAAAFCSLGVMQPSPPSRLHVSAFRPNRNLRAASCAACKLDTPSHPFLLSDGSRNKRLPSGP